MRRNSLNIVWRTAAGLLACLSALPAVAQLPTAGQVAPLPRAESVIMRSTDPYSGSIPQGKATGEVLDLTVLDALDRGMKYNLGLFLADQTTAEARAMRLQVLSRMMPTLNGTLSESVTRTNLAAFGFKFPGLPSAVGPFGLMSTQATGYWNMLNASSIDEYKAAGQSVKAAQFNYQDARDLVVLTVGANYLLTIAQESRVEAIEAEVKTAETLFQLAKDQEAAGIAPNIDTLRARVQLQAQQESLIQAQNDLEKQRIALARVIGLPVTQKFRLVNRVPYAPVPDIATRGAYELALQTRSDYKASAAQLRAAELRRSAAWKEYLPNISGQGAYGVLGYTPSTLAPNYSGQITLNIPIFQGGRVQADMKESETIFQTRKAQMESLRGRIEQEVQDSILDLNAAARQVEVAKTGLDLAQQTLDQSQDRFAAGVTNNVEVIQAQQQFAYANDQYISSLFAHNIAKILLARSIGNAEQMVKQYLAGNAALPPSVLDPTAKPAVPADVPPASPNPPQPN